MDHRKSQIELSTVLANILKVFRLIKDSLPGTEPATPYTITLGEEEEDYETDPPKEVRFHTSPPEEPILPPSLPQPTNLPQRPKRTIVKPDRFRP